jgi:hypothetical protein
VTSGTYALIEQAMRERSRVACVYQGKRGEICPIVLGWTDGREKVLAYQVGGESSRPLRGPETRWRCMWIDEVSEATLVEGAWVSESTHKSSQTCVKDVDLDVNPASPFGPRRRL